MQRRWRRLVGFLLVGLCLPAHGQEIHRLADFGPVQTPAQAQATYAEALLKLRNTGGVLLVPGDVLKPSAGAALQGLVRSPAPPAQTRQWREGPGITVVALDEKQPIMQLPPLSGLRLERQFRLAPGDSAPHWGTHPMLTLDSNILHGSVSYLDYLQDAVSKGADRRFYLATVRGLRAGQFLNIHGGPGYGGGVTRACVKSLGYDAERHMSYLVADTDLDHQPGAILHNKSNTGLLQMRQTSHNDNQTYDVKVIRNQYAHGDAYVYYCDFNYMSNVHSAAGDENGNCYAAFIRSLDDNFRATVESMDWVAGQLSFAPAAQNIETLGDSRPLINRNPAKSITAGKVFVVAAEGTDGFEAGQCRFEGRTYPTRAMKNPRTGVLENRIGGLIRGSEECPWTPAVVGRWFAITHPQEMTPKGNLRWYLITAFRHNADGTKEIEIERFWWGARSAGGPTLYRADSHTWDGHLRPLSYIIAPGTYVNDVSWAAPGGDRGGQRKLGLAPYADQGTPMDFQKGDDVEQAIGPDPFRPQAMRVWMWEDVPGAWPSAVFDLANYGAASRYAAMTISGGGASLADAAKRQQQKPAWDNVIVLDAAAGVGINCKADFADAAILFQQPYAEQAIKWRYGNGRKASLTVSKADGQLSFNGGGVRTNGPVSEVAGLSGDGTPARNLRGKNIPVAEDTTTVRIRLPQPEADGDYAVFVEQSWLCNRAISAKSADGFTITFASPAPKSATVDWMIVR